MVLCNATLTEAAELKTFGVLDEQPGGGLFGIGLGDVGRAAGRRVETLRAAEGYIVDDAPDAQGGLGHVTLPVS